MLNKIFTGVLLLILITTTSCASPKKEVPAETVMPISENANKKDIQKELGEASSKETNKESGITANNYENSNFAGYNGQISFYYDKDGSVLYYKWSLTEKDEKKAKEIYSDVCQALSGSYGDGEENNSEASGLYTTSFTNDKQQITAQLQKANGSGYEISYMVVD